MKEEICTIAESMDFELDVLCLKWFSIRTLDYVFGSPKTFWPPRSHIMLDDFTQMKDTPFRLGSFFKIFAKSD
jgi:hypothetical protein